MPTAEPVVRSVSSIRRNGWNEVEANRAIAFLAALLPAAPSSADAALATELLRWLAADLSNVTSLSFPDLPCVPEHLEPVARILAAPAAERIARLREAYRDPTALLIELISDLDDSERADDRVAASPHADAILALGELGTLAGTRFLGSCLSWPSEGTTELILAGLMRAPRLADQMVELWTELDGTARAFMCEALATANKRDDRVCALVAEWIDRADDAYAAIGTAAGYRDRRLVRHLLDALDRAINRSDDRFDYRNLEDAVEACGGQLDSSCRKRIEAVTKHRMESE